MPNAQQSVDRECWRAQKPGVCCVRCAAARLSCNLSQFTKYQNNLSEMNWNERFRVNYVNICIESSTGNTIDTPYCRATPLLSTSNCEHPELETRSHLTENGGQCMNCLFFDLLCDHETSLMACFWTCEESRLWKKYIAKESKTLCSLLWLPWHLSWSKAMMFTSSGAHRLTPLLTMANPPISEYQSNVMLQFSFLPNIQFWFSPDSPPLPSTSPSPLTVQSNVCWPYFSTTAPTWCWQPSWDHGASLQDTGEERSGKRSIGFHNHSEGPY